MKALTAIAAALLAACVGQQTVMPPLAAPSLVGFSCLAAGGTSPEPIDPNPKGEPKCIAI
jgi:hypothetical protein